jgi:hypothetical protein
MVGWWIGLVIVERDRELDFHVGAVNDDVLDDEAHELLAGIEVEPIERGADLLGEAGEPPAQAVLACQLRAMLLERFAFRGELPAPRGDCSAALCELGQVDQLCLVGVEQPVAFALEALLCAL